MSAARERVYNVNVGILGHVDSGKTSLAKALSMVGSTAAFDKHPESQERGITLDLGFSAFYVDAIPPEHKAKYDKIQFTLVDCPGHASLIRTIMGGAQIIDMMILVIDITKGIQTQTAECIVIGEITADRFVIVLNKIDQVLPNETDEKKRQKEIDKIKAKLAKTFAATKFKNAPMVPIAAAPHKMEKSEDGSAAESTVILPPIGLDALIQELTRQVTFEDRAVAAAKEPFLFAVDHCFGIRGQGTVLTGTVLQGVAKVNQTIEIAGLKVEKKIKSMQRFKQPVQVAVKGDRVGICVTQFDSKLLERGLAAEPGTVPTVSAAICSVEKIRFFKQNCPTKSKFHVTVGHTTVMATAYFFLREALESNPNYDFNSCSEDFFYLDELLTQQEINKLHLHHALLQNKEVATAAAAGDKPILRQQYVYLEFEKPITAPQHCKVIASRLDTDIHSNTCRLAFHGVMIEPVAEEEDKKKKLRIFKTKQREASIDRVTDDYNLLGKNLIKPNCNKNYDLSRYIGKKVVLEYTPRVVQQQQDQQQQQANNNSAVADGAAPASAPAAAAARTKTDDAPVEPTEGKIDGSFGKSGKFKCSFRDKIRKDKVTRASKLKLYYKTYIFDETRTWYQE